MGNQEKKVAVDESIYFMGAVHPAQVTKITSGWIKTGTNKAIKTIGSSTRVNIIGCNTAVSVSGDCHLTL